MFYNKSKNPFQNYYYNSNELSSIGFKKVGSNVHISKNCTIVGLNNISIGNNVRIDGNVVMIADEGFLSINNCVHIGANSYLSSSGGITIKDFVSISPGTYFFSASDDYNGSGLTGPMVPKELLSVTRSPIILEKHSLIGSGSRILPGVKVGEGVSVAALSVVNKSLDPWSLYGGIPAKKIRSKEKRALELEKKIMNS